MLKIRRVSVEFFFCFALVIVFTIVFFGCGFFYNSLKIGAICACFCGVLCGIVGVMGRLGSI